MLISGEPGIGKSTILLQMCKYINEEISILYISGEESPRQIKMRAERLEVSGENITVFAETDMAAIKERVLEKKPGLVIIDSIPVSYTHLILLGKTSYYS